MQHRNRWRWPAPATGAMAERGAAMAGVVAGAAMAGVVAGAEKAAGASTTASRTAAADTAAGRGKRLAALAAVNMAEKAAGSPPAICSVMSVIRLRAII